jgi:hypothetical protein
VIPDETVPQTPPEEIPQEEIPLAEPETILDDEVPLAKTDDNTGKFSLALLSLGMTLSAAYATLRRKVTNNHLDQEKDLSLDDERSFFAEAHSEKKTKAQGAQCPGAFAALILPQFELALLIPLRAAFASAICAPTFLAHAEAARPAVLWC